jgi:hypothetical protein
VESGRENNDASAFVEALKERPLSKQDLDIDES